MKVTILGSGTSQGVPVIGCTCEVCQSLDFRDKRLRSSIHIEVDGTSIVIDSGPDFRQQMLREKISSLDALIFTHEHKDHTAGMDDIRSFNFMQQRDMPVYGRPQVIEQLKQEFSYVFAESKYPGVPRVDVKLLKNEPFKVGKVEIRPVMYLALSYDHRIIDGRESVGFLVHIKEALENPAEILMNNKIEEALELN